MKIYQEHQEHCIRQDPDSKTPSIEVLFKYYKNSLLCW